MGKAAENERRGVVRVWAVVGPQRAGKSPTIGILTSQGIEGRTNKRDVLLRGGGYLRIWAFRQSLQERRREPEAFIAAVARKAREPRYLNVLVALRSDEVNGLPRADGYLRAFWNAGWALQSLVLLEWDNRSIDYEAYARFGVPTLCMANTEALFQDTGRHAELVGHVRNHFGWA
jgi:hypothetical protein